MIIPSQLAGTPFSVALSLSSKHIRDLTYFCKDRQRVEVVSRIVSLNCPSDNFSPVGSPAARVFRLDSNLYHAPLVVNTTTRAVVRGYLDVNQ